MVSTAYGKEVGMDLMQQRDRHGLSLTTTSSAFCVGLGQRSNVRRHGKDRGLKVT